jgi:hypothetical protein
MKTSITKNYIKLIPETKKELELLHNAQYRRVYYTQLIGKLPDQAELLIKLNEDSSLRPNKGRSNKDNLRRQ